uniref:Uncharacterized protein n=1 Tax=Mycena chlorophos TaxID=658473 RepID=A0ABQ0LHN1_MYCCL|nr:predicted protein [Mycena chlorophos]
MSNPEVQLSNFAHTTTWQIYRLEIMLFNQNVALQELHENATVRFSANPLATLSAPWLRVPVPAIPPPPAAGAQANLPPAFIPPTVVAPPPPQNFPATKGELLELTENEANNLLAAYGEPDFQPPAVSSPNQRARSAFANFIGVAL